MIDFFSKEEEGRIISTIKEAEKQTSGEIRVHLERDYEGSIMGAAYRTFLGLGMDRTKERNGVLIFLVPERKDFAIYGDRGINEKVPNGFWEEVRNVMQGNFRDGRFAEGVCQGVQLAGEKLRAYFPWQKGDKNELPDEISYGR
ncbi:MAG: TPM domain-containing protein [Lewinellaceae bacterium]|nr:TPM domain-containing protein [Saprospiraceae bacterium]MCB9338957.1 TPM domain-containing protein [Lewinellaceae bacterium]